MLHDIFLPPVVKNNFIISTTILEIYIVGRTITAITVLLSGKTRVIKNYLRTIVEIEAVDEIQEKMGLALEKIIVGWSYDSVKLIISGSNAFITLLKLPFNSIEKIKMVAPFEIEHAMPFSLSDGLVDALLIDPEKKILKIYTMILWPWLLKEMSLKHIKKFVKPLTLLLNQ